MSSEAGLEGLDAVVRVDDPAVRLRQTEATVEYYEREHTHARDMIERLERKQVEWRARCEAFTAEVERELAAAHTEESLAAQRVVDTRALHTQLTEEVAAGGLG